MRGSVTATRWAHNPELLVRFRLPLIVLLSMLLPWPARAATEVKWFIGFETQNEWESPDENVPSSVVVNTFDSQCEGVEDWSLEIGGGAEGVTYRVATEAFACSTSETWVYGAYVQFHGDLTPPSDFPFLQVADGKGNAHLSLELHTNGSVYLHDANGAEKDTLQTPSADTWYLYEICMEKGNDPDGVVDVHIDGVWVGGDEDGDYWYNAEADCALQFIGQPGLVGTPSETRYGSGYVISDIASASDLLSAQGDGSYQVVGPYQAEHSSSASDEGSSLDSGDWGDSGETPYNGTNQSQFWDWLDWGVKATDDTGGSRYGPKGDSRVASDDGIQAASWLFKCAEDLYPKYGKCDDASPNDCTYLSDAFPSAKCDTASPPRMWVLDSSSSYCPDTTEYFAVGFSAESMVFGGWLEEAWAFLLYTPSETGIVILRRRIEGY